MKRWFLLLALGWIVFHLLAYIILPLFIPYLGFFPYKDTALSYHLPGYLSSMANFDGEHYILIAERGYAQFEQAFFPLYPMLIRGVGVFLGSNYLLAGILISTVSFFVGLFFFKNFLQEVVSNKKDHLFTWRWSQLFLLLFPTSFFFTTVYTEGLFFFLAMAALYFVYKKNFVAAAVLAILASLTRLVGVFLFIPILFSLFEMNKKRFSFNTLYVVAAPFVGLFSYMFYLWKTTGDPLFFLNSQSAFGANRSSHLILFPQVLYRYIKIFMTSQHNFQYFISIIEFAFFVFVLLVLCFELGKLIKYRNKEHFLSRLSLNLFSFANLLLPTFTGTFSSVPRYVLTSFSFFIFLGEMKNTTVKIILLTIFAALHIILFGFFIQGYFVS